MVRPSSWRSRSSTSPATKSMSGGVDASASRSVNARLSVTASAASPGCGRVNWRGCARTPQRPTRPSPSSSPSSGCRRRRYQVGRADMRAVRHHRDVSRKDDDEAGGGRARARRVRRRRYRRACHDDARHDRARGLEQAARSPDHDDRGPARSASAREMAPSMISAAIGWIIPSYSTTTAAGRMAGAERRRAAGPPARARAHTPLRRDGHPHASCSAEGCGVEGLPGTACESGESGTSRRVRLSPYSVPHRNGGHGHRPPRQRRRHQRLGEFSA